MSNGEQRSRKVRKYTGEKGSFVEDRPQNRKLDQNSFRKLKS